MVIALVTLLLPRVIGGEDAEPFRPGIVLLDAKTGKQSAFIPPAVLPEPGFTFGAEGRFWATSFSSNSVFEIEARTGKVLKQFPLPSSSEDKVTYQPSAVADGALWTGDGDDLIKIDTNLGREVDRFELDTMVGEEGLAEGVAIGDGVIWVSRDAGIGQVVGIDPAERKVRHRFDAVRHHDDIAVAGDVVFAVDFGGVNVLDPSAGTVVTVEEVTHTSRIVTAGGGFGWTSDPPKGIVYKITPAGQVAATYHTGQGANGVAFADGVLWVANTDEGTVTGIDGITGKQTTYRLGHPINGVGAGSGVVFAALGSGRSVEDRIDALSGNVLKLFSQQGALGQGDEPALAWNVAAFQVDYATCAKLLNYPDQAGPQGLQLQPEVAQAMPTVSADGRTYTFTIRAGYRFSPPVNEPLTAETFRYSIERALSPKLGDFQPAAFYVSDIEGEQAFRDGKSQHISGLRANGDQLSITLTAPSPDFLERLALPFFCPVPAGTPFVPGGPLRGATPTRPGTLPSAGPYYVAEYSNDVYIILRRNPNYHGPRPHKLDAIALRESVDAGVAVDRVLHGGWGGIVSSGHNGTNQLDPLLEPGSALAARYARGSANGSQYVAYPLLQTGFLALNTTRGPFADPVVRRAAALAIDRTAVAALWHVAPSERLLPPALEGSAAASEFGVRPDLAEARRLLHGRRVHVAMAVFKGCDVCSQEADLIRTELGQAGIVVKVKEYDDAFGAAADPGEGIDLIDSGSPPDYTNAASFLSFVVAEGVPEGWLTRSVRNALEALAGLTGTERSAAAVELAGSLATEDVAVIAYGNLVQGEFFGPNAGCRVFPPAAYGVDLAALCLR